MMKILICYLLTIRLILSYSHLASLKWEKDDIFKNSIISSKCDFPTISADDPLLKQYLSETKTPLKLSNMANLWNANNNWQKSTLIEKYGERIVKIGSQPSIVYSGGEAEGFVYLKDFLSELTKQDDMSSSFVFDTTILKTIPELYDDFSIPIAFSDWDSPDKEERGEMWHFLSLGPSRAGLPFHNHGKTWITTIHGSKLWFFYPPGFGNSQYSLNDSSVLQWLENTFPSLALFEKPNLQLLEDQLESNNVSINENYRPFECFQDVNETLFIPSLWAHLTINIGETIAIGGQQGLSMEERLNISQKSLSISKNNFETLKDIGLSMYNAASNEGDLLREEFEIDESSIIYLNSSVRMEDLLQQTYDSWVVLYARIPDPVIMQQLIQDYRRQVNKLLEIIDVNFAIKDNYFSEDQMIKYNDGYEIQFVFFSGLKDEEDQVVHILPTSNYYIGSLENLYDAVNYWITNQKLRFGSINTLTNKIKQRFREASKYFQKALEAKPNHPEIMSILAEISGLGDNFVLMEETIERAKDYYDNLSQNHLLDTKTLASYYHKLSNAYIARGFYSKAVPLLTQSLSMHPIFIPSLRDYTRMMIELRDKEAAEKAFLNLKNQLPASNNILSELDELEIRIKGL